MRVQAAAYELAGHRADLEGDWTGREADLAEKLGEATHASARLLESSVRMDLDGATRRIRCAEAVQVALGSVMARVVEVE